MIQPFLSPGRRSFFARLNSGAASLAAVALGGVAMAQQKSTPAGRWEPARHEKDDWLDQLPGKHRLIFDTTMFAGFGDALAFARNFMAVNRAEYGLENSDLAVVIVARHRSTPFGYNNAMWEKYGTPLATRAGFEDPKSKTAPKANVFNSGDYGNLLTNRGTTLDSLSKEGVQFAVCSMATRAYAALAAETVGGNARAVFDELTSNLVSNARMVPAGIVAVNRAQERGYSLASV